MTGTPAVRPRTRRDLALQLLRDAGGRGVTTAELIASGVGARYSARVLELRELGFGITSERVRDGQWRYTLVSEPGWRCAVLHEPDAQAPAVSSDPVAAAPAPSLFDVA
jgi:hypothetical protein